MSSLGKVSESALIQENDKADNDEQRGTKVSYNRNEESYLAIIHADHPSTS
jgi:hypothetical protein